MTGPGCTFQLFSDTVFALRLPPEPCGAPAVSFHLVRGPVEEIHTSSRRLGDLRNGLQAGYHLTRPVGQQTHQAKIKRRSDWFVCTGERRLIVSHMKDLIIREEEAEQAAAVEAKPDPVLVYVGGLSTQKRPHGQLVFEGVCVACAHCGMALSDSCSVERGIGPKCSSKGYMEEPKDADEMQAMISLAEFPEVCQFLVEHYRPKGVRGLMNGMVRLASLNRGNYDLHLAITDAIESLGYVRLANALRESLSVVTLKESEDFPGCLEVQVKRHAFKWEWYSALKAIPGWRYSVRLKRSLIPVKVAATGEVCFGEFEGRRMSHRQMLWELLVRHYLGMCGRVIGGTAFKITPDQCGLGPSLNKDHRRLT